MLSKENQNAVANALKDCKDTYISSYYGQYEANGHYYVPVVLPEHSSQIITELFLCGSIDVVLGSGIRLSEAELRMIAACCVMALFTIHSHDRVHGVV